MVCNKCGNQLPEGAQFCAVCGTAAPAESVGATQVPRPAEAPVFVMPEDHELKAPAEEASVYDPAAPKTPTFEIPSPDQAPKKKKGKFLKIGLPILAAVAVLGVLGVIFGNVIVGYCIKLFGSNQVYMEYVEEKAMASFAEGIDAACENAESNLAGLGDQSVEGELGLTLSNDAATVLSELTETDFGWFGGATVPYTIIRSGGLEQAKLGLTVNDTNLLMLESIVSGNKTYMSILPLNEMYLKTEQEQPEQLTSEVLANDPEIRAFLMESGEVYERLLNKYWAIIMGECRQVEQSQGTLVIGELEQKCTELTVTIDDETLYRILKNGLEALRADEDVKKLYRGIEDILIEKELLSVDSDAYETFQQEIDNMLKDLEAAYEDADKGDCMELTTYVDHAHRVIGRALEAEGKDVFSLINFRKGRTIATELILSKDLMDLEEDVILQGTGTVKKGAFNGSYFLEAEGTELLELEVEDLGLRALQEEAGMSGTLRITPTAGFFKVFSTNKLTTNPAAQDYSLEIKLQNSQTSSKAEVTLFSGENVSFGLTLQQKTRQGEKITLPTDVIEDVQEWWQTSDMEQLVSSMEAANLPEELILTVRIMGVVYSYQTSYPML